MLQWLPESESHKSPLPPDLTREQSGVTSKTPQGAITGDVYWSESENTGYIVAYSRQYRGWWIIGLFDFDVSGCCDEVMKRRK
jgi:hypothetical protein